MFASIISLTFVGTCSAGDLNGQPYLVPVRFSILPLAVGGKLRW